MSDSENQHWLWTPGNIVWIIVLILLLIFGGWSYYQAHVYNTKDAGVVKQIHAWQNKVDDKVAQNERIIYLPKPGNAKLSSTQMKAVSQLTSLFSRITTFDSQTAYETNYHLAKNFIFDSSFYQKFLYKPVDSNGQPIVTNENLRMQNVRTQVLVTGNNTYTVIVTYIPYHAHSDLYQRRKLETMTQIINMQGTPGHWTKAQLDHNMDPNAIIYHVNQVE